MVPAFAHISQKPRQHAKAPIIFIKMTDEDSVMKNIPRESGSLYMELGAVPAAGLVPVMAFPG